MTARKKAREIVIRPLPPTPRARRQRRRVALWALWCLSWPVVALVVTWNATPSSGPAWGYLGVMAVSGVGVYSVTRD